MKRFSDYDKESQESIIDNFIYEERYKSNYNINYIIDEFNLNVEKLLERFEGMDVMSNTLELCHSNGYYGYEVYGEIELCDECGDYFIEVSIQPTSAYNAIDVEYVFNTILFDVPYSDNDTTSYFDGGYEEKYEYELNLLTENINELIELYGERLANGCDFTDKSDVKDFLNDMSNVIDFEKYLY